MLLFYIFMNCIIIELKFSFSNCVKLKLHCKVNMFVSITILEAETELTWKMINRLHFGNLSSSCSKIELVSPDQILSFLLFIGTLLLSNG